MQLLIVRHSQAEKREDWNDIGNPDNLRPLTKRGLSRFAEATSGLDRFVEKIDHIYTSQYTRSIQTGEILHGHFTGSILTPIEELNPLADFRKIITRLKDSSPESTIALVGHQPELSSLISFLLGSEKDLLIRFKKGGASLVSLLEGSAQLQWVLTQRQLCYLSTI